MFVQAVRLVVFSEELERFLAGGSDAYHNKSLKSKGLMSEGLMSEGLMSKGLMSEGLMSKGLSSVCSLQSKRLIINSQFLILNS